MLQRKTSVVKIRTSLFMSDTRFQRICIWQSWSGICCLLNIESDLCAWHYNPLINPRCENVGNNRTSPYKKFLQHKTETYNTQGSVGNRTCSLILCRWIEPAVLTTRPRRPRIYIKYENYLVFCDVVKKCKISLNYYKIFVKQE